MSDRQINIAVDAMGGDNSPLKILLGSKIFLDSHTNTKLYFFGNKKIIEDNIIKNRIKISDYEIIDTKDDVENNDTASIILRNRKTSSIYKGLEYVKNKECLGFVSAGNTAALMILSRLLIGTIEGIDRPAICSLLPSKNNFSIMLDLGANVSVNASNLLQFALMGYSYFSIIENKRKPKIGIVNIGTEDNKGFEFLKEGADLISKSFLKENFIGFIEPNHITSGICDIIICDGYTGNIILKTAEGMSQFITNNLKNVFHKSIFNKLSYKVLQKDLINFRDQINPDKYNGATLIGLNGISIKSHGSANPYAFSCALERCYNFIYNDLNKKITDTFNNL